VVDGSWGWGEGGTGSNGGKSRVWWVWWGVLWDVSCFWDGGYAGGSVGTVARERDGGMEGCGALGAVVFLKLTDVGMSGMCRT